MKTAEQYAIKMAMFSDEGFNESAAESLIEEIQIEAIKHGMGIAYQIHQETPPSEHWECGMSIQRVSNGLTILNLPK